MDSLVEMASGLCIDEALNLEVTDVEIPLSERSDEEASEAGTEEILISSDDEDDDDEVQMVGCVSAQAKTRLSRAVKSATPGSEVLVLLPLDIHWRKATFVINVLEDDSHDLVEIALEDGAHMMLETYRVASALPPTEALVVSDRVLFDNSKNLDEDDDDDDGHLKAVRHNFCAGFVTETPSKRNRERYLVFMENEDTAKYFHAENLRLTFAYAPTVPRQFVASMKNYARRGSERFLLSLEPGKSVNVSVQEARLKKFVKAAVERVDCSVALLTLKEAKKREWIWRGSIRFQIIKDKYDKMKEEKRRLALGLPVKDETSEEVKVKIEKVEEGQMPEVGTKRSTARKSTKAGKENSNGGVEDAQGLPGGLIVNRVLRDLSAPYPTGHFPPGHRCNLFCSVATAKTKKNALTFDYLKKKAQIGLLDWPRLMGFQRRLSQRRVRVGGRGKTGKAKFSMKWVTTADYIAPCDRRLRNEEEVLQYLIATDSLLSVDMFCFSPDVDPEREFIAKEHLERLGKVTIPEVLLPYVLSWKDELTGEMQHLVKDSSKDFSERQESLNILWVDSFKTDIKPQLVKYLTGTVAEGVELNIGAKQFRSCCDCLDGCANWKTCACRGLTNETARGRHWKRGKDISYQYRRLREKVVTGIFECNPDCACAANAQHCVNRVGQNEISVKLELVMTEPAQSKGWAVRALQDIPDGAFICSYAGEILHDRKANKDGRMFDDKYFLELDYITVNEEQKEGYEETVVEPEKEEIDKDNIEGVQPPKKPKFSLLDVLGDQYVMDSLKMGNIGRFFNHSCEPNLFPQTVFIGTHDPRFPVISLFTSRDVKAGEELCWDYRYELYDPTKEYEGEVRTMRCLCGAQHCQGTFKLSGQLKSTGT